MRPFNNAQTFLRTGYREIVRSFQPHHHPARRRFLTLGDHRITTKQTSIPYPSRSTHPLPKPRLPRTTRARLSTSSPKPAAPSPNPTPHLGSPEPNLSLSQRLRKLSREYGWSAVGVYFALSALDFPFCFLAVRIIGAERIGHWEHVVVGYAWRLFTLDGRIGQTSVSQDTEDVEAMGKTVEDVNARGGVVAMTREGGDVIAQASEGKGWNWGVEAADEANKKSDATIWTQLALAYAIHKSFIFLRVPATVAVTPKVVKVLRGWGWNVGKMPRRTPKSSSE